MPNPTRQRRLALLLTCVIASACSPVAEDPGGPPATAREGGRSGAGTGGRAAEATGGSGSGGATAGGTSGSGAGGAGTGGAPAGGSGGAPGAGGNPAGAGGSGGGGGRSDGGSPAPDTNPGNPVPPGMRKVVILHDAAAGASNNDPSRRDMVELLGSMKASHGIVVELMDSPTPASALMDKALVIVGPNSKMFGENHPDAGLKTLPVPLMVSKDGNTTEIGLGRVAATDPPTFDRITIVRTDHPLAAGLPMGNVVVNTTPNRQRIITFTDLGPGAIRIATGPQSAMTWSLIAYETGGDMGRGLKAPAKRVGFFWHRPAGLTENGTKLFKAAVDWLLKP